MNIQEAAERILDGNLVVFPTETVYGLGALASHDEAVKKIFSVKGRPAINPLIVHISEQAQLSELVLSISPSAKKLMEKFWPGPLTICFRKSDKVSDLVTAGLPTVCVRMPDHEIARALLKEVDQPIAAPSANLSGKPSTTTFEDAKKQLEQKGVFFLDGGQAPLGLESTVVDCSSDEVKLLRPGVISKEDIEQVLGETIVDESSSGVISSPGQLLEHYAPMGQLTVLYGSKTPRRQWLLGQSFEPEKRWAFGVIGDREGLPLPGETYLMADGEEDIETYAQRLYQFLNWCDRQQATRIILELPAGPHPVLPALLNRLQKASRGDIISV